ncbi:RNA polymerase sigma factor [Rubripirellula lacrimiformis]|uniref:RNA polymerase sigma factor n=1 Tax=Rubripirellula lacrimiformis TaxID=1930273 RepID=A0A517NH88_9BACT|nr:sigma-70 family RNA polymerase sigma factor [Rubripirellula lacrimiformis]QDT06438.1 RNA polymerase sigma factor [Rubripirellula lacrimiformis]
MATASDTADPNDPVLRRANDRSLVARVISGSTTAWRSFVHQHERLVRTRVADVSAAFGRGDDESAIDDATAEVFAAMVAHDSAPLRAFQGRSSLATFIAVIATRSATRYFARNRLVVAGDLPRKTEPVSDGDHVARVINADHNHRVQTLIDRLPPRERSVVALFHLQGQSYAQISQKLEIPIGTIGPTLRHAETQLRQWMEEPSE